ncbi:MAG: tetratricopeptide repeat protein [Magnetococcales bacterium]|nr:tetratricopeptide repeat protein [Magnetococcales bacterium]
MGKHHCQRLIGNPLRASFLADWLRMLLLLVAALLSWSTAALGKGEIRLVNDPETSDLLDQLGEPLVQAAGLPAGSVHFHVILETSLNAFALENGNIFFNSGLLQAARGREELAGVIAHEVAHLSAGHHIKIKDKAKNLSLTSLLATVVGIAAGVATGDSSISQGAILGGAASTQTALLSDLRQKERQADRLAVLYLSKTGLDPQGIANFLERIHREQRLSTLPPPYLLSHPISTQRLSEARDLAQQHPPTQRRADTESAWLVRVQAKLEAGLGSDPAATAQRFEQQLQGNSDPKEIFPIRYGLALARRYGGQLAEAETLLSELLEDHPQDPYLLRERGLVRMERNNLTEARRDFETALEKLPDHQDLRYQLASVLSEQKEYAKAGHLLRRLISEFPQNPRPFYLLGLVEGQMGRPGHSHLALARHHRLQGEEETALWHYREAARRFPPDSPERKITRDEADLLEQKR